jgi:HSP20 family molecular chaperone IbpA
MECKSCGERLDERWDFCPYCGMEKSSGFYDIFGSLRDTIRDIFKMDFSKDFDFGSGFMIEVSQIGGEPKIRIKDLGREKKRHKEGIKRTIPDDAEVVEPEVKIQDDESTIEISLPGVKSEKDILIKKFENSIELRGHAKKRVYFTIVPIPRKFVIAGKKFKDGRLTINIQ